MKAKGAIKSVRGVKDVLPSESLKWRLVEETALEIFTLYNFKEIRIPTFEKTEVFKRSIGETTDIVEKEMYTFTDRGGESLTLRPEGTASVVRAYVENGLYNPPGVTKLFYMGPMFRAERPQAGRFRQFHQIGAEVFGTDDPAIDAEVIIMLMDLFTELRVPGLKVLLNSLGCPECRPAFRNALYEFLKERESDLCKNCQSRIDRNPLRALDCKSPTCKAITENAPTIDKYRCDSCETHFNNVRKPLLDLEIPVTVDPKLMRGLDYYSRTAFEVVSEGLGAQNSVAGGGRYDSLVEQFGGPKTPAIGFALGIERLISLLASEDEEELAEYPDIFIVPMTETASLRSFEIAHRLRSYGYQVERTFGIASMKSMMKKADRSKAKYTLIIGEDELKKGMGTLRNMNSGEQIETSFNDIADILDEEP
ncbi:Histidyl-tRNA synthetase [hydrothermal vent metagenome]|uniref:histidine--tRNA ligase n=1 Tax=hydrothermal vent metagenome TaxID=652676 RepID=A0A3B1CFZ6_9ZZZZ